MEEKKKFRVSGISSPSPTFLTIIGNVVRARRKLPRNKYIKDAAVYINILYYIKRERLGFSPIKQCLRRNEILSHFHVCIWYFRARVYKVCNGVVLITMKRNFDKHSLVEIVRRILILISHINDKFNVWILCTHKQATARTCRIFRTYIICLILSRSIDGFNSVSANYVSIFLDGILLLEWKTFYSLYGL